MLNVIAYPSFTAAFVSSSTLRYDYGYLSSIVRRRFDYHVLFALNPATQLSSRRIRGYFNQGVLKSWHDRSCFHVKYDGNIVIDRNLRTPQTALQEYFNHTVEYAPTGEKFGAVVSPGTPYIDQYRYYRANQKQASVCYMYAYMTDDHMYYGFLDLYDGATTGKLWWFYSKYDRYAGKSSTFTLSKSYKNCRPEQLYAGCNLQNPYAPTIKSKITLQSGTVKEVEDQLRILNRLLVGEATRNVDLDFEAIYGELAMDAINSVRFVDTNSLQFLLELTTANQLFTSLVPKEANLKSLSQAYLSKKYGADNTLRDIQGYLRGAQRQLRAISPDTTRATRSSQSYTFGDNTQAVFHYKVVYGYYPSQALNVMRKLDEWALLPNGTILWDMIPLSFVADWFADVGSLIEKMDFHTRYQMYDVKGVTRSCKITSYIREIHSWEGMALSGVKVVQYVRQTRRTLDLPKFGYKPPETFRNVAELTALLVANTGHHK